MPFENGYPTEDDRKTALYALEPEQISDLVFVPHRLFRYVWYNLATNGNLSSNSEVISIQKVNFPLSAYPCLFQRYNPYGKKFADEYSLKLYNFLLKYSHTDLADRTAFIDLPRRDNPNKIYQNYSIGNKLEIVLPENNLIFFKIGETGLTTISSVSNTLSTIIPKKLEPT